MASERKNAGRWIEKKLASAFSSSLPAGNARMSDDETSVQVLRAGSSISIVFLIGYLAFFLATWTPGFRRHWKHWNLLFAVLLISIIIMISSETQEGESRYI